jgi:hypothetical protein
MVDRGEFDAGSLEPIDHWIELVLRQYEISHRHRATRSTPHCNPATECQRWFDRGSVHDDVEIATRKAEAMHVAGWGAPGRPMAESTAGQSMGGTAAGGDAVPVRREPAEVFEAAGPRQDAASTQMTTRRRAGAPVRGYRRPAWKGRRTAIVPADGCGRMVSPDPCFSDEYAMR